MTEAPRPRAQHYSFVHGYMRDKCLLAPVAALNDFFHKNATEQLKLAWVSIGLTDKHPDEDFIDHEGIEVVPFTIGNTHRAAILVFPKPEQGNPVATARGSARGCAGCQTVTVFRHSIIDRQWGPCAQRPTH